MIRIAVSPVTRRLIVVQLTTLTALPAMVVHALGESVLLRNIILSSNATRDGSAIGIVGKQ